MLSIQLKPVLRIALPVLLLWMHFSMSLCEANSMREKYKTPQNVAHSVTAESSSGRPELHMAADLLLQKHETSQSSLHSGPIKKKLKDNELPTVQQPVQMEKAPEATDQPVDMVVKISKIDPLAVEIGPRITLDTLPICKEGFKLFGNHCRKEA